MCICFEDELNDETKMLVGTMELRELKVLSDQAQKREEICNNKKPNGKKKPRDFGKQSSYKLFSTPP